MRVRPRAIVIALLALVALDLVLRLPLALPVPKDFRVPSRTLMGYDQLLDAMARDPGKRVAVIGDSISWGGFAEADQTVSAYLNRHYEKTAEKATAYNVSLIAARSQDLLPTVQELSQKDAADVIVMNFDYRWYRDGQLRSRYPELFERVADWEGVDPALVDMGRREAGGSWQDRADDAVSRVWRLFALRDYIASALFGERPSNALVHAVDLMRERSGGKPLYFKRSPKSLPIKEVKASYAVPPITERNVSVRYLGELLDVAERSGIDVVVYVGPVDSGMLDGMGLWDRASYERDLAVVKPYVEAHGGRWVDYTDALPRQMLRDTHHPLANGYRKLAAMLLSDAPELSGAPR